MLASAFRHTRSSLLLTLALAATSYGQDKKPAYPAMAPFEQYRMADRDAEIALARTAAPPSISADADVLVLGASGYETAVKGTNGFVCFVERSWTAGLEDREFWNSKLRAPNCFNPQAARSVLPQYLARAQWAAAGATREQFIERTRAAFAEHRFTAPEPGALTFMLSKNGYLSDQAEGPWLPHMMFFVPHGQGTSWGASRDGSPVIGGDGLPEDVTILLLPVRQWSDGTPAPPPDAPHTHEK
jgi:hypothetical protein